MNTGINKLSEIDWLTGVPYSDVNFRSALKRADLETLYKALAKLERRRFTRTACMKIRARIRELKRAEKR